MSEQQYQVATQRIQFGGVNAYTTGQLVTTEAVEANGWQDFVADRDSAEGRLALGLPEQRGSDEAEAAAASRLGQPDPEPTEVPASEPGLPTTDSEPTARRLRAQQSANTGGEEK